MRKYASDIEALGSGTTFKEVSKGIVERFIIPLPPLEEQRRIAAILDKADGVRRKRKEAIRLTEELLKSTFLEMFGYSSDESVSIGELLDKGVLLLHKDGNHGSNYPRTSEFGIEGIPFLSANCFSDSGEMITDNVKFLSESKANKLKIGWLEHSDVLLAHNATVGRVALYDGRYKQALVGTSLTIFRPHREYLLPEFLFGVLRSEMFQKQLAHNMEQSTRNQVPITAQRDLKIKLAPLKKQLKFKELFHHVMNISKKYESSNQESENLFNSLLQKAFRGEL
jgi:type I restriction enzyme S subunit